MDGAGRPELPASATSNPALRYTARMTPNDFRKIALSMQDAIEGEHMAHPDFRANGRIFATLHPDGKQGMVKLTPDQQQTFMRVGPNMFTPASGAWGRQGCTMVQLSEVDEETLGEAMTLAWQQAALAKLKSARSKRKPPKRSAKTQPKRRG